MALDRVLSLISLVLALVCTYEARRLWTGWGGAGLMPAFAAVHFLFLTVVFIVFAGRTNSRVDLPSARQLRMILFVAVTFAIYIAALETVGYLPATWAMLAIVLRFTSKASGWVIVGWPGFLAIGSYLLFAKGLGTHLPASALGF